jgi:hypothetical protein
MDSQPTESDRPNDADPTPVERGIESVKHAAKVGIRLGRRHGPVVARKTADGLKRAGGAIRDSEQAKRIAARGKKAGRAAGRAVKKKVGQWPWMANTGKQVSKATARAARATRDHISEKRYFEKSIKMLDDQLKRYPAIEDAMKQARHAFTMKPESSSQTPSGGNGRSTRAITKKTTRKKTATHAGQAKKKTVAKKTTTKKKTRR